MAAILYDHGYYDLRVIPRREANEQRVRCQRPHLPGNDLLVLRGARLAAHRDTRYSGQTAGADLDDILHAVVYDFIIGIRNMRHGFVFEMEPAQQGIILGVAFDAAHKMRRIVIAFVRHDTNGIGYLQGGSLHLVLSDTHGHHRTRVPGMIVGLVIGRCIGDIAAVFAREIDTDAIAKAESINIFFPFGQAPADAMEFGVVYFEPERVAEKGITGVGDGQPQVGGMTRFVLVTFYGPVAGVVRAQAVDAAGRRDDAFIQADERAHRLIGGAGGILALDRPVE